MIFSKLLPNLNKILDMNRVQQKEWYLENKQGLLPSVTIWKNMDIPMDSIGVTCPAILWRKM